MGLKQSRLRDSHIGPIVHRSHKLKELRKKSARIRSQGVVSHLSPADSEAGRESEAHAQVASTTLSRVPSSRRSKTRRTYSNLELMVRQRSEAYLTCCHPPRTSSSRIFHASVCLASTGRTQRTTWSLLCSQVQSPHSNSNHRC